jgi:hypothetical protein
MREFVCQPFGSEAQGPCQFAERREFDALAHEWFSSVSASHDDQEVIAGIAQRRPSARGIVDSA